MRSGLSSMRYRGTQHYYFKASAYVTVDTGLFPTKL